MDTLENYIIELEKDVRLDQFNIRDCQMKLPAYKHKWVGRLMRHKHEIVKLNQQKYALKKKVAEKIQSSTTYKVTKPVAEKAAANHDSIVDITHRIEELNVLIEFLEKAERILSSMTYDIKNLVEIMRLETT
jgi:hypothetical protein